MRFLAGTILLSLVSVAWAGTPEPGFSDTSYVSGLAAPTATAFLPDGRLLITQQGGALILFDGIMTTPLGTIAVCSSSEMGLLGVAVDPSFGTNGLIYLYRTHQGSSPPCGGTGRVNEVVSVVMTGTSISAPTVLLTGIRTDNGNHDGGVLRIGPDGKLYVGVGDTGLGDNQGGPGSSTNPYAQDLNELEGKILRLNLDGTAPSDNPFFGMVGKRAEIFAYGFRNPFRMSFDGAPTNSLWVADVGDLTFEEIDIVTSGKNYSWPYCEANAPSGCMMAGDVAPVFVYPHSGGTSLGTCIIGGSFVGAAFGSAGDYVFGDCTSSDIYRATLNGTRDGFTGSPVLISSSAATPADFVTGPDGAIYYAAETGGEIRRLAVAIGDQLLSGKRLVLRDNPSDSTRKRINVTSKDTLINLGLSNGSSADPVQHGGSVRVVTSAGAMFDDTYPLPMGPSWSYIGNQGDNRGYRYKDPLLANGPIRTVMVRPGKVIKVVGKGAGLGHSLGTNPDPVQVELTTGDQNYCMSFGGGAFSADQKYIAADTSAPGSCPP
jgi:glucose/arabinose dehydrogenase